MTADRVFNDTVHYLSRYDLEALIKIASDEFGIKADSKATKEEVINKCALVEANNFVH